MISGESMILFPDIFLLVAPKTPLGSSMRL